MLEESGTVVEVRGEQIRVETISRSSCSKCSSSGCSTSVVSKLFGFKRNQLIMDNTLAAQVGDRVVIGVPDALLVKASIWAYFVPLVCMGLMTWLVLVLGASEALQALGALFGLVVGLYVVNRVTAGRQRAAEFTPLLLRMQSRPGVRSVDLNELIDF